MRPPRNGGQNRTPCKDGRQPMAGPAPVRAAKNGGKAVARRYDSPGVAKTPCQRMGSSKKRSIGLNAGDRRPGFRGGRSGHRGQTPVKALPVPNRKIFRFFGKTLLKKGSRRVRPGRRAEARITMVHHPRIAPPQEDGPARPGHVQNPDVPGRKCDSIVRVAGQGVVGARGSGAGSIVAVRPRRVTSTTMPPSIGTSCCSAASAAVSRSDTASPSSASRPRASSESR